MTVIENLYTDISSDKRLYRKLKRIKKRKLSEKTFVITYPLSQYGLLEIYDYNELLQNYYKRMDDRIVVIGISESRGGAYDLVTDILEEVLAETNGFDIRSYINAG